jgi:hypothetical protein
MDKFLKDLLSGNLFSRTKVVAIVTFLIPWIQGAMPEGFEYELTHLEGFLFILASLALWFLRSAVDKATDS